MPIDRRRRKTESFEGTCGAWVAQPGTRAEELSQRGLEPFVFTALGGRDALAGRVARDSAPDEVGHQAGVAERFTPAIDEETGEKRVVDVPFGLAGCHRFGDMVRAVAASFEPSEKLRLGQASLREQAQRRKAW